MCFSLLCWQVEIKNLNSFSAMNRAIDFEISRQVSLHSQGQSDQIVQETRLWEEGGQKTVTMRKYKEGLSDYRYFPEPDLPEVILTEDYVGSICSSLPELPELKRRRYEKMGLSMQDVLFLANDVNPPRMGLRCLLESYACLTLLLVLQYFLQTILMLERLVFPLAG
uniref:Aspartyl/Glutamyl-tRNA(Gln) amidotransferase subunit B/E catalytic domain-containing protein n=1 Tax=Vitis vinifera TaxID=29760 RepID=A5AX55_VITVI|nr:hypothetical protein VITISV_003568 [Vitis vinifera]